MMFAVSTLVETYIEDVITNMFQSDKNKSKLKKQHEDIVHAIADHDSTGASIAMLKHLEYTNDYISKTIKEK
jgi:GntR family transcriptional repressor for pyruvate dehydrogenase complex